MNDFRCFDHPLGKSLDLKLLDKMLAGFDPKRPVITTLLSKAYLEVGKLWLSNIGKIPRTQFILFVIDQETLSFSASLGLKINTIPLTVPSIIDHDFISNIGFGSEGLLITSAKFPIVKYIIEQGFDVIFSDIDALLLRPIPNKDLQNVDFAFQRVIYHPKFVVDQWGFAICTGFLFFKRSSSVIKILADAIRFHKIVYCDQLALNLAVFKNGAIWELPYMLNGMQNDKNIFTTHAGFEISGKIPSLKLRLKALPATTYYRNNIVELQLNNIIIFHPNSPKDGIEKLKTLTAFY